MKAKQLFLLTLTVCGMLFLTSCSNCCDYNYYDYPSRCGAANCSAGYVVKYYSPCNSLYNDCYYRY